jgi:hypothetical protein
MEQLNDLYLELINPNHLITLFKSDEEFESWCECGDLDALQCTLKAFEEEELYEHCAIIFKVIKAIHK